MAGFLYAILLWKPYNLEVARLIKRGGPRNEAFFSAADSVFKKQNRVISVPWRVRTPATEVWDLQPRLERRIPKSILKILENRRFRAAYDFFELRSRIGEVDKDVADWWTKIQEVDFTQQQKMIDVLRKSPGARKESETTEPGVLKKKSRRRRYRGKKNVDVNASSGS
jgi:poly(A) polymerase